MAHLSERVKNMTRHNGAKKSARSTYPNVKSLRVRTTRMRTRSLLNDKFYRLDTKKLT